MSSHHAHPDRHHRQRILPEIGDAGQERLRRAHAAIIGCGALGTHLADTLCRAGVGWLTIIDRDIVEHTNLQRQILFTEDHANRGAPKAEAARDALHAIDPDCNIRGIVDDLNANNVDDLLTRSTGDASSDTPPVSLLLDGTDNFETRFLLNDLAVARAIPLVYAGVIGTTGLMTTVLPARKDERWSPTPCLRCLFDDAPPPGSAPTCDTAGVLGPAVSIIAAFQATEALKILTGDVASVTRALLEIDAWRTTTRRIDTTHARNLDCPCCAHHHFDYLDNITASSAVSLCGRNAVQITPGARAAINLPALAARLAPHGDFHTTDHLLRGVLHTEPIELTVFPTGRAIIRGVEDASRARAIYARFIGA